MKAILRFAGKNGAWVVVLGIVVGFCIPMVSNAARPYLALAIFLFTFGSFLKLDSEGFRQQISHTPAAVAMVLWATFGVPLVVFAIIWLFKPAPGLTEGLLFWSLVPTSPACVAFSVILGLSTPLALLATVAATAASPFCMPLLAAGLGGYHLAINPTAMSLHLLLIVGGAALAAYLVKRFAAEFVRDNPDAMTGIAVFALVLAGTGSMAGMQSYFFARPIVTLELLALAYALNLGFQCAGTMLFWRSGRNSALTAGLISGTRTITLGWVVLGANILPLANVFFGVGMVAKYTAPALTKWLITRLNRVELPAMQEILRTGT
jgi:bile acid:Na+ symporter, BASS family